jgi:hypothetical protein
MKRFTPRPTYANVVATAALFVALGGVSYAATQLPEDSVGTNQLQQDSVTSGKVQDGTLKPADFGPETWDGSSYSASDTIARNSSEGPPFDFTSENVFCDPGDPQIGGGFVGLTPEIGTVIKSFPMKQSSTDPGLVKQGWALAYRNAQPGIASGVIVIVRCADFPPAHIR